MNKYNNIPGAVGIPAYDTDGEASGEVELPVSRLGGKIYRDALRQAVITYEANRRSGTAKTRTRAEVSYSGIKPWPQKGTGRARAGSRGSPIWVGGGVAHGPRPRDYSMKLNKKMKKRALASALLGKALDGELKLIDRIVPEPARTGTVARLLERLGVRRSFMIVVPEHDPVLWRCTRNIAGASMRTAAELNPYEVLKARDLIFFRDAFDITVERLTEVSVKETDTERGGIEQDNGST